MFACTSKKKVLVGYFDKNTRVVGAERYFVIQRKSAKTNKWVQKHYYSHFSDMLRAYARMLMLQDQEAENNKSILQILDRILVWETKIEELGERLQKEWKTRQAENEAKEIDQNARPY